MNVRSYLDRIGYHGSLAPTAEVLRELQVAHLSTVPFENLSIHAGEPIVLADQALFEKIVMRRRGGFCYELNGLFAALLRALGFDVRMLSAEVAHSEGGFGPAFDHMALLVSLDDRWLVDVGFGDSFREPLAVDNRNEQQQNGRIYRIESSRTHLTLIWRDERAGSEWKAQYRFTLQPYEYADYEEMCRYHQTSPASHFRQGRICTRATSNGRITLSGRRLITNSHGIRQERLLNNEEEVALALREHFGIEEDKGRQGFEI
ncbi:MAG: arylamine N-acetyltransferase [Blastocatellia bacterium]|nr:arylamine N-acetyltransferase [Blastocatellia bacterium]